MQITPRIAMEIASHEAIVRQAYKDSVGTWTWSVGLTNATGHNVERYIGKPQTLEHCLAIYVWALNNYAEAVRSEFKGHDLTEEQFGAALSFHWNTGAIRSATWPDFWKEGKIDAARKSFLSWRKPAAIIRRRKKEAELFFDGQWSSVGLVPEYTALTSSHTPVWSSSQGVDVSGHLKALLNVEDAPAPLAIAQAKLARIAAIINE